MGTTRVAPDCSAARLHDLAWRSNLDLVENTQSDVYVWLTLDDVETAQVTGVHFARALADAPDTVFMIALSEQQ